MGIRFSVVFTTCLVAGCTAPPPSGHVAAVVYGDDDRQELFAVKDGARRTIAEDSGAALVLRGAVEVNGSAVTLVGPRYSDGSNDTGLPFCASVPFRDQPAPARCSGVLIDSDLVATAGHCVDSQAQCKKMRVVFGHRYDTTDALHPLTVDDVYPCAELLYRDLRLPDTDMAVIRLARPVTGRKPAGLTRSPAKTGDALWMVGHPGGVPAKLDDGGAVLDVLTSGIYQASVDAFGGNSGSPVFRGSDNALVGLLTGGLPDYVENESQRCAEVNEVSVNDDDAGEIVRPLVMAISELCAAGLKSQRLCSTAPRCGDGTCSGGEDYLSCDADCAAPLCGDGVCTRDELAATSSCEEDCGTPVPAGWTCHPGYYDGSDGCDQFCGVPDPDCLRTGSSCSAAPGLAGNTWGLLACLILLAWRGVRERSGRDDDMPR